MSGARGDMTKKELDLPTLTPLFLAAWRSLSRHALCPSWSPWEKLKRATFIPASIICSRVSTLQQAGPRVQMIFVLRDEASVAALTRARLMLEPLSSGPFAPD